MAKLVVGLLIGLVAGLAAWRFTRASSRSSSPLPVVEPNPDEVQLMLYSPAGEWTFRGYIEDFNF